MHESRMQIYAAVIGALMALAIAIGGFLYQNGQLNGHIETLDYREKRIEQKVDMVYEEVVALREWTARTGEQLRFSLSPRAGGASDALD